MNNVGQIKFSAAPYSIASAVSGAVALDASISSVHIATFAADNISALTITGATPGQEITLILTQDSVGSRTLTLGTGITNATGATITPTATANTGKSVYKFICTSVGTPSNCQLVSVLRS